MNKHGEHAVRGDDKHAGPRLDFSQVLTLALSEHTRRSSNVNVRQLRGMVSRLHQNVVFWDASDRATRGDACPLFGRRRLR